MMTLFKGNNQESSCKKTIPAFEKVFKNTILKKAIIEIYLENPFMLLTRTLGKNLISEYKQDNLIISNENRHKTRIVSIPLSEIKEYGFKQFADNEFEISFEIQNVIYKVCAVV